MPLTNNATARREWIDATVAAVDSKFMDGVTFDYESPMEVGSEQASNDSLHNSVFSFVRSLVYAPSWRALSHVRAS